MQQTKLLVALTILANYESCTAMSQDPKSVDRSREAMATSWLAEFPTTVVSATTIGSLQCWQSPINDALLNTVPNPSEGTLKDFVALIAHVEQTKKPISCVLRADIQREIHQLLGRYDHTTSSVMECDLLSHNRQHPAQPVHAIEANRVDDWMAIFNEGFGETDAGFTQAYSNLITQQIRDGSHHHYCAGYDQEKLVAIGTLSIAADYGEICNIATKESHRNRGYASAVVNQIINYAAQGDLLHVYLLCAKGSDEQRLYTKLGFQPLFELINYTITPND